MFLTGAAQNYFVLKLAEDVGVHVEHPFHSWFTAAVIPASVSFLLTPLIALKLLPPDARTTPDAPKVAQQRLDAMGPISIDEKVFLCVMLGMVALWASTSLIHISPAVTAFCGIGLLLMTGVITWEDCARNQQAWSTFVSFAILVGLAERLKSLGIVEYGSNSVDLMCLADQLGVPLACGPGVPGEFEFLPYTRLEHDLASSSQESKNRKTALAGKEGSLEYYEFQMGDTIQQEGSMESSCPVGRGQRYIFVAHGPGLDFVLQGQLFIAWPDLWGVLTPAEASQLNEFRCPHSFSVLAARKTGVWAAPSQLFREAGSRGKPTDFGNFLGVAALVAPLRLNYAFLIKSGQLKRIETPGREEKLLEAGDCVGKRLLLYGDKSGVTIQATQRCELILLNVRRLRQLIGKQDAAIKLQQNKLTSILLSSPVLSAQSESLVADICKSLELSEYLPGAKIPPSIGLFVVLDGKTPVKEGCFREAKCWGSACATRGFQASHGFAWLRQAHLIVCCWVRTDDVADMKARVIAVLSRVSIFRQVQEATLDALFHCVKTQIYRKGDEIVKQGAAGDQLTLLTLWGDETRLTLVQGGCFGERAVRCEEPWPTSFHMASAEGEVWFWDSSSLLQAEWEKPRVRDFSKLRSKALGKEIRASEQLRQRALLQDPGVKLRDLHRLGQVGTGTSGTVWLVRHKESGARYALKRMEKVDDNDKVSQEVQREIEILSENDHPFLMHMVKALETLRNVYVLAEYVGGGELEPQPFYAGSILLMVEALHERNVVYRDLKPENILLDEEGYLKLVDFGTAKKLDAKCGRTFTLVGTTHYMAPEVMRGKGYGLEVDVWALGILLYELLCGQLPFGEHAENDREVCRAVLAGKPRIPSSLEDSSQRILVSLLEPRPRRRLGCGANGLQEIKDHGFFRAESHHNGDEANRSHGETEDDFFTPLLSLNLSEPKQSVFNE
ncbi:cGMP-dependent protein kinase [Durusdinium trenchii]|uniref:cGMP-dependent protein kinase n=1 Tax=Durusdinium trenchii TaxID=1381693 RepID=A0ABP0S546_9DINO